MAYIEKRSEYKNGLNWYEAHALLTKLQSVIEKIREKYGNEATRELTQGYNRLLRQCKIEEIDTGHTYY